MATCYEANKLNAGDIVPDCNDVVRLALIPTWAYQSACIRYLPTSKSAEDKAMATLVGATIDKCVAPVNSPGIRTTRIQQAFADALRDLDESTKRHLPDFQRSSKRARSSSSRQSGRSRSRRRSKTPPRPSSSSASTAKTGRKSTAASDSRIPGKYAHKLDKEWFVIPVPTAFKKCFSSSISSDTKKMYTKHVKNWINFCRTHFLDPVKPSTDTLVRYLSLEAFTTPVSATKLKISALKKFMVANLQDGQIFESPALKAFILGLTNRVPPSTAKRHQLAMNTGALRLAGHILQAKGCS